jgi:hypothetical protein
MRRAFLAIVIVLAMLFASTPSFAELGATLADAGVPTSIATAPVETAPKESLPKRLIGALGFAIVTSAFLLAAARMRRKRARKR